MMCNFQIFINVDNPFLQSCKYSTLGSLVNLFIKSNKNTKISKITCDTKTVKYCWASLCEFLGLFWSAVLRNLF